MTRGEDTGSMADYLPYYLSPLTLLAAVAGLVLGGPYVWLVWRRCPSLPLVTRCLPRTWRNDESTALRWR